MAAITATFTVAGDVASFNQNAFRNALATLMGVSPSVITLSVTSASVSVTATITYPTQAAASAVATLLAATPAANFTAALGVTVQAVSNIAPTSVAVTMPSPAPPPYIPGVIVNADGTVITSRAVEQAGRQQMGENFAGDINGDGLVDALFRDTRGGLWLAQGKTDATGAVSAGQLVRQDTSTWTGLDLSYAGSRTLMLDLNGDLRSDLLWWDRSGAVKATLGQATLTNGRVTVLEREHAAHTVKLANLEREVFRGHRRPVGVVTMRDVYLVLGTLGTAGAAVKWLPALLAIGKGAP
jgi:hypothetical protein